MIKIVTFVVLSFVIFTLQAQENKAYLSKVQTLDITIETLYGVISGEKGEARDWELMRYLFHSDAKLIPTFKNKEGNYDARYMTANDYVEGSGNWLIENGFFEKEIHRVTNTFGNITQLKKKYIELPIPLETSRKFLVLTNLFIAKQTQNHSCEALIAFNY